MSDEVRIRRAGPFRWCWDINPFIGGDPITEWCDKHGEALTRKGAENAARKWIANRDHRDRSEYTITVEATDLVPSDR